MIYYLRALLLALVPLQVFYQFQSGDSIAVRVFQILCFILVLLDLALSRKIPRSTLYVIPVVLVACKIFGDFVRLSVPSFDIYSKLLFVIVYIWCFERVLNNPRQLRVFFIFSVVSVVYSIYQYFIALTGGDYKQSFAELDISKWNPEAWHVIIIRDGVIRVPGFSFEAAYQTILLGSAIFIRYAQVRTLKDKFIYIFAFGLALSFSRNGLVAACFLIFMLPWVKHFNLMIVRLLPFATLILPILASILGVFTEQNFDSSVISRFVPIQLFINSGLSNVLFGIDDYSAWIKSAWPVGLQDILYLEKVDIDPKSLPAFLMINFGVIGLCVYAAAQSYVFRKSALALVFVSAFNLLGFNVGTIFFPIQWLLLVVLIRWQSMPSRPGYGFSH